jgi:DNA-binding transcriptional ArsR family regulator
MNSLLKEAQAFAALSKNLIAGSVLLDAMSNPARLRVLCLLTEAEMSVGVMAESLGMSQSALSQHLAKLRVHGLVGTRRDAQTIYYRCENPAVLRILDELQDMYAPELHRRGTADK